MKAPDFDLLGVDGKRHSPASARGEKGLVVMFICNHCPYVKKSIDRIVSDCRALSAQGIGSIAIMPNDPAYNAEDSFDNMKRVAREKGFSFPYVIDETQDVARAYDAVCTPEFLGYNADLELQYHGRLDASKTAPVANARRELFEAMVAIAQTGKGPSDQTAALGCSIKWKRG